MKKTILIFVGFAAAILAVLSLGSCADPHFEVPEEGITFHRVNLVCCAASDMGCGSRSKPILLDLEKNESIAEAWLNRKGTVVAVVWEEDMEPDVLAVPAVFREHGSSITTLSGKKHGAQLAGFRSEKWYRGAAVDELSMEEAGRIAHQIIDPLVADHILPEPDAAKLTAEVEKYIQNEFMILEDVALLSSPEYYDRWEVEIQKMMGKYLPAEEVPIIEMGGPSCKKSWFFD